MHIDKLVEIPDITLRQLLDVLLAEGLGPDNFQAAGSSKLAKPKRWKVFVRATVKAASPMQQPQSGLVGTTDADKPKYEISPTEIGIVVTASELGFTKPDDASAQVAEDPMREQPSSPLLKTPNHPAPGVAATFTKVGTETHSSGAVPSAEPFSKEHSLSNSLKRPREEGLEADTRQDPAWRSSKDRIAKAREEVEEQTRKEAAEKKAAKKARENAAEEQTRKEEAEEQARKEAEEKVRMEAARQQARRRVAEHTAGVEAEQRANWEAARNKFPTRGAGDQAMQEAPIQLEHSEWAKIKASSRISSTPPIPRANLPIHSLKRPRTPPSIGSPTPDAHLHTHHGHRLVAGRWLPLPGIPRLTEASPTEARNEAGGAVAGTVPGSGGETSGGGTGGRVRGGGATGGSEEYVWIPRAEAACRLSLYSTGVPIAPLQQARETTVALLKRVLTPASTQPGRQAGGDEIRRAEEQAYAIEEQMFRRYVPMHEDPGRLYINQLGSLVRALVNDQKLLENVQARRLSPDVIAAGAYACSV